jgi:small subunit ribosomal protein S6
VNDYEILLMLDPELPEERQGEILTRTQELVAKHGGAWESTEPWGRRRLAYEIDHKAEGVYHLMTFSTTPETLDEVSRVLKITDGVMRHMATRRPKPHRRATAALAGAPPPTDAPKAAPEEGEE